MTPTDSVSLKALAPYVPRTLIEASIRHGGAPVWHEWLDGALMHCDITGFTAMSESLASLGNEGAELMAGVLNDFFDTMLAVADAWGGVQMKFGGDAMLLYFGGDRAARRAASCGLEMQQLMPRYKRVAVAGRAYELRMRIGIHAGRFFSVSAGAEDAGLQYVLLGRDVNETADIEARAKPGHVVATRAAIEAMGDNVDVVARADGVVRVRSLDGGRPAVMDEPRPPAVIRRYVLPALADAIDDAVVDGLPAEQRRVTSMFVMLDGSTVLLERAGEEEAARQMSRYVALLVDAVGRHGGVVLGSDVAEHGDKFIVLFGAPVLQEEHEASAIRCAAELTSALESSGLELRHQIGINTGTVFAGEIGSRNRREYTVIGDTVNLAARLMAAAKAGETLVSAMTVARAGHQFAFKRRRPIRVKGKREPVRLFELVATTVSAMAPIRSVSDGAPFVGREAELSALVKGVRAARRGDPAWSLVSGDTGIGKTRIAEECSERLSRRGWTVMRTAGRSHATGTPFGIWIDPLRQMVGVEDPHAVDAGVTLRARLEHDAPDQARFVAVLADLLGVEHGDNDLLASLDARGRRDRLTAIVTALLSAQAERASSLFVVDDAHWVDESSFELMAQVLDRVQGTFAVLMTTREADPPQAMPGRAPSARISLRGLRLDDARVLLSSLGIDEASAGPIAKRAQGNPLFLIEMARAPAGTAMPETVNDVVLARLDALRRSDREVLRLASVIGPSFDLDSISALEKDAETYVVDACGRLIDAGLLHADDGRYAFAHALTREVAYETLLYADRRRLHRVLAVHIEREHSTDPTAVAESLLQHYGAAREWSRVARYGVVAGDRAASIFATQEATRFYQSALNALDELGATVRVDRSIVMERLGDALDTAGQHREAGDAYFTALHEWLTRGSARRPRHVESDVRVTARESLISRKISVSYERRSDYEQALSWIETALERLPAGAVGVGAEVMASKSVTLFRRGAYAEAIEWGERAVSLARRSRDRRVTAYAHNMLANSYIEQGALKQAVRHLAASERLYRELHDLKGQSAAGNNLASCHQLLGNMDEALQHYEAALEADMRLGNATHAAIIHNNIGEVLLTVGRIGEAREHLQQVLDAYGSGVGLQALTGLSEVNLSRCALLEHDPALAESHALRAIRLLRGVGAQGLLDEAELQLVEVRIAQGRLDVAIRRCREAVERARASGARLLEARGLRVLGVALAGRGNVQAAREHLDESVSLARAIDAGLEEGKGIMELARLAPDRVHERGYARALDRAEKLLTKAGASADLRDLRRLRETSSKN